MMDLASPVRFLTAGMGGYAWTIASGLLEAQPSLARLGAVCDPAADTMPDRMAELERAGVAVYRDFATMLDAEPADAVWLPLPIHLHRSYTERSLQRGLDVVCEKPAAGCLDDVDAMIAARDSTGRRLFIAFQDLCLPTTRLAKQSLLDGAIGRVTHATLSASWPRSLDYFRRNAWAGAMRRDGVWVLDSPLQNALAHPVNLILFLLGRELHVSAEPRALRAELYRANDIENCDTTCLDVTLDDASMIVFLTHASDVFDDTLITFTGTRGTMQIDGAGTLTITGETELHVPGETDKRTPMIQRIASRLRGDEPDALVATAEIARAHALVVSAASQSTPVREFGQEHVRTVITSRGEQIRSVPGIVEVMRRCVVRRQLPHDLGDVPWSRPAGTIDLTHYRHFTAPATA